MKTYKNLNGNSNVTAYQYGRDYILVEFNSSAVYKYTYASAGVDNIEEMKMLADRGYGLNGFINRYCKYDYECKL